MTTSEVEKADAGRSNSTRPSAEDRRVGAPARPTLIGKPAAPVIVKVPPPLAVRFSQVFWLLSLVAGAVAVVYMVVIRQGQLPEIEALVRAVDATRADATYTTAADIIFWAVFTPVVAIVLVQIALQVSFANRRPNVRWWLFGSLLFQGGVVLIAREFVAFGERGLPLERILQIQLGLAVIGLLFGLLPPALRWTARQHDVRSDAPVAPASDGQL